MGTEPRGEFAHHYYYYYYDYNNSRSYKASYYYDFAGSTTEPRGDFAGSTTENWAEFRYRHGLNSEPDLRTTTEPVYAIPPHAIPPYHSPSCAVSSVLEVPSLMLLICLVIITARLAWLIRQIENNQPEIPLLPPKKWWYWLNKLTGMRW